MKNLFLLLTLFICAGGCGLTLDRAASQSRILSRESAEAVQTRLHEALAVLDQIEDLLDQEFKNRQMVLLKEMQTRYPNYHQEIAVTFDKVVAKNNDIRDLLAALRNAHSDSTRDIITQALAIDSEIQTLVTEIEAKEIGKNCNQAKMVTMEKTLTIPER